MQLIDELGKSLFNETTVACRYDTEGLKRSGYLIMVAAMNKMVRTYTTKWVQFCMGAGTVITHNIHCKNECYLNFMRGSRELCQRGSKFDNVVLVDEGDRGSKYRYKWAIIGPTAKRHLNGVSLAGRWWPDIKFWLGSFVIFQGAGTSIAKKPYMFVIFQGVWTPCPPLDPPMNFTPNLVGVELLHIMVWYFNCFKNTFCSIVLIRAFTTAVTGRNININSITW